MNSEYHDRFDKLKCCVIIPTYNNSGTLAKVLDGVLVFTSNVFVVNDGSTDSTQTILSQYKGITALHYPINKGKGSALRLGFKTASDYGFEYAITIDSDGQHSSNDLPKFIDFIEANPASLIVGARNMEQESIPGKSSFGHRFSNFWYWVETGIHLPDTQSGYRLYPIKQLKTFHFFTVKFEFEIEVLVRAAWKGILVHSVPVSVYYAPEKERISHFRPFTDFFRISILNSILVTFALLYVRPFNYFRSFTFQKLKILLGSGEPTTNLSLAVGFGVFMGIIPIWGYQMITAAFLAHFFKLNKALVLLASNITFGPMIPIAIYGSLVMGKWFVDRPVLLTFNQNIDLSTIKTALVQYLAGSLLLAVSAGIIMTLLAYTFLTIKRKRFRS